MMMKSVVNEENMYPLLTNNVCHIYQTLCGPKKRGNIRGTRFRGNIVLPFFVTNSTFCLKEKTSNIKQLSYDEYL